MRDWPRRVTHRGDTYLVHRDGTVYQERFRVVQNRWGRPIRKPLGSVRIRNARLVVYLQSQADFS